MTQCAVIMAVYNESPDLITRSVQSILGQTFQDFSFVIVDDGSTAAETLEALALLPALDKRIRVLRKENGGPMSAANFGIQTTDAPLIMRQDSDDWSSPQRFEKQVAYMAEHPEIVVVGSACRQYQENEFAVADCVYPATPDKVKAAMPHINPIAHGSSCFRRAAAEEIGLYDAAFRSVGDYDFFWRLIDHAEKTGQPGAGGANLPDVLYHYVFRTGSVSERRVQERRTNRAIIHLRAEARQNSLDLSYADALAKLPVGRFDTADALVDHGDDLMRAGMFAAAAPAYIRGWLKKPSRIKSFLKLGRLVAYALLSGQRWRMFKERFRVMKAPFSA